MSYVYYERIEHISKTNLAYNPNRLQTEICLVASF